MRLKTTLAGAIVMFVIGTSSALAQVNGSAGAGSSIGAGISSGNTGLNPGADFDTSPRNGDPTILQTSKQEPTPKLLGQMVADMTAAEAQGKDIPDAAAAQYFGEEAVQKGDESMARWHFRQGEEALSKEVRGVGGFQQPETNRGLIYLLSQ